LRIECQRGLLANYGNHPLMKTTTAKVINGKEAIFTCKLDGVDFEFSDKRAFMKFIKDYDKEKAKLEKGTKKK